MNNYQETSAVKSGEEKQYIESSDSCESIDSIIQKRKKIKDKIKKYQIKITDLEYKLIELDRKESDLNQKEIINNINLNEQQMKIVKKTQEEKKDQNMLVLACPGSGKTHTLIARYINLVTLQNVDPERILLITFTKKAGQEMENRINDIIPTKSPYYVGSLHGLGYRVLQRYDKVNYTVLDDKDCRSLIKEVVDNTLNASNFEDEDISVIKSKIIMIIEQASTSYPFNITEVVKKLNLNTYLKIFKTIVKNYQDTKKRQNLIDFNDLMIRFAKFLDTKKSIEFTDSIDYLFFDEYQDVNPIQNHILTKFKKSKVMVVGDDAQSIYKFRGSDVKFIRQFSRIFISDQLYYLETNYRSTKQIVDFCQNIVSKNHSQYVKKVTSLDDKEGTKPHIIQFNDATDLEQYKWICHDIKKRNKSGVPYSDMVILARKNSLLDKIEVQLVSAKIPTLKHLGISLLDKAHIKDFMAFITILVNTKSSIHWKRILSLHPTIGIIKANNIIEFKDDIFEGLKILVKQQEFYKRNLTRLVELLEEINRQSLIMEKIKLIVSYLQDLWKVNKTNGIKGMKNWNIEEKVDDTKTLLGFMNNQSSLEEFVNNIHLNQEVDAKYEDCLFLTTVHGAKGLEWKYVYIIDMDSKNFPAIMPKFYLDELEEMEEERRLFYVASSRAKDQLTITYHTDFHPEKMIVPSPLIKELDKNLYIPHGLDDSIYTCNSLVERSGIVSRDVSNFFRFNGFYEIRSIIDSLEDKFRLEGINTPFEIPNFLNSKGYKTIMGNFFDYTISKILLCNFPDKVTKFDLNIVSRYPNFSKSIYHNYIDPMSDWRNSLEDIFFISSYKYQNEELVEMWKEFLLGENVYASLVSLEKGLVNYLAKSNIKKIYTHYNLNSHHNDHYIKGELDVLVDDHLLEIKSSAFETCTLGNLSQALMYGHLLQNKVINDKPSASMDIKFDENTSKEEEEIKEFTKIKKISIYNPVLGIMNTFDTSKFDFEGLANKFYPKEE